MLKHFVIQSWKFVYFTMTSNNFAHRYLQYWLKRIPCFSAFLLHVGVGIVLFVWTPQKEGTHIFFICVALWVIGYSVYSSILSCKYFFFKTEVLVISVGVSIML